MAYEAGSEYTEEFYHLAHSFNIPPDDAWDGRFSNSDGNPGWRLNKILQLMGVEEGIAGFNASNAEEIVTKAQGIREWANENLSGISGKLYNPDDNFSNFIQAKKGYEGAGDSLDPINVTVWHTRMHRALGYTGAVDTEKDMTRLTAYADMYLDGAMPTNREEFDAFLDTRIEHAAPGLYVEEGGTDQSGYYDRNDERHGEARYKGFGADDSWWSVGGGRVDLGEDGLLGTDDDINYGYDQQVYERVLHAAGGYLQGDNWEVDNLQQEQHAIGDRKDSDPWVQVGRLKNDFLRKAAWVLGMDNWESLVDIQTLSNKLQKIGFSGDSSDDNFWAQIQNVQDVVEAAETWNANNPDDQFDMRPLETIENGTPNEQAWGGGVFENETLGALETDSIFGWRVGDGFTEYTTGSFEKESVLDVNAYKNQPQWQEAAAALGISLNTRNDLLAALDWMGADTTLVNPPDREDPGDYSPPAYVPGVDKFEPEEIEPPDPLGKMIPHDDPNEVRTTSAQLYIKNDRDIDYDLINRMPFQLFGAAGSFNIDPDEQDRLGWGNYTLGTGDLAYARENLVTLTPKMNIGPLPTLQGAGRRDIRNPTAEWTSTTSASDESVRPEDRYTEQ